MSIKEIKNANITKANITRDSLHTIHKHTLTNTSNNNPMNIQINQQQQTCERERELLRRQDYEPLLWEHSAD